MDVIPAIDIRDGRCVRLRQGRFDRVTEYEVDPVDKAREYAAAGLPWLHVVDLDGARDGERVNGALIEQVAAATPAKVQLGGGIRSRDSVRACLDAGVDRVVVGSAAVTDRREVCRWLHEFGSQRIVVALDVRVDGDDAPTLLTEGWQNDSAADFFNTLGVLEAEGLKHLLCTDISRDGMLDGPNEGLYRTLADRFPGIALQASGGVRDSADLRRLDSAGASAAIVGKSLLEGHLALEELEPWSRSG